MRNHLDIVKALLSKTIVRGATVGEEAAAVAKAVELIGKHAIPRSAVATMWPQGWGYDGKRVDWKEEQRKREQPTMGSKHWTPFEKYWLGLNERQRKMGLPEAGYGAARRMFDQWQQQQSAPKKEEPVKTGSIGNYARQLLLREIAGKPYSYAWIIESIQLKYPHAKTTVASLRWYENELRKQGRTVPTKRPAK